MVATTFFNSPVALSYEKTTFTVFHTSELTLRLGDADHVRKML